MNFLMIAALSSVVLLAGCTKNESRRSEQPTPAAGAVETPVPEVQVTKKVLPPDVSLSDREFQTQYGQDGRVLPSGSTDIVVPEASTTVVVTPDMQVPRVDTTQRVDVPGVTAATAATRLEIQPSRPVEIIDASPATPVKVVTSPSGAVNTTPVAAATGVTTNTTTFKPMPAPSVEDEVDTEASPTHNPEKTETRRGQEQRFRPMPKVETEVAGVTSPSGAKLTVTVAPTGKTDGDKLTAGTGPAASTNTTVVVVAATGITGATGKNGANAPSGKPVVVATAEEMKISGKITAKEFKVLESKAYSEKLAPLMKKIRSLHAGAADRLEKKLKETSFKAVESSMVDASNETKADALVSGFQIPAGSEYTMIHLKSGVLLSAMDLNDSAATAKLILESVLLRAAYDSTSKKDNQFMSSVLGLSRSIADSFLKNSERLNKRMVYEYLRYAQINTSDWTFEQLDAIAASTAILRLSLRQYTVTMAEPKDAFKVTPVNLDDPKAENCKMSITYHGIEKGVKVMVAEPEWREFEFDFDVQSKETYPMRPSMAGDQFEDLEIISKQADKSSLRLTVRFAVKKNGDENEREADHMVLEKLPEKGKAEKILMCKIVPHVYVPPRAKTEEEKAADAKNQERLQADDKAVTAATGVQRGQEQRFRPMPKADEKAVVAPTGKVVVAPTGKVTPVTAVSGQTKATAVTAATGTVRGQEQRFRPMPKADEKAVVAPTGKTTDVKKTTGVTASTSPTKVTGATAVSGQTKTTGVTAATGLTATTGKTLSSKTR